MRTISPSYFEAWIFQKDPPLVFASVFINPSMLEWFKLLFCVNVGHLETCLTLRFKTGYCWHWFLEMWGERSFLRYRGGLAEGNSHPVPRTLGALGLSTLSEHRGRFFPCHIEQLNTDDDYDEWVYQRGKQRTLSFQFVCLFVVSPGENNRGLHFVEGFIVTGRGILNGPPLWAVSGWLTEYGVVIAHATVLFHNYYASVQKFSKIFLKEMLPKTAFFDQTKTIITKY